METDENNGRMVYFSIVLGMIFSTALVLVVAFFEWLLLHRFDRVDTEMIVRVFYAATFLFRPELVEKVQYITGIILFPLSLYFSQRAFMSMLKRREGRDRAIIYVALSVAAVLLVYSLFALDFIDNPFYTGMLSAGGMLNIIESSVALAAIFCAYALFERRLGFLRKISAAIFAVASLTLIAFIAYMNVFSKYYVQESAIFFGMNAFFYPVSQVFAGKALLVDLTDQYGLYPHLLEPIFRITGLSVLSFTAMMAVLLGISFLCIFLFMGSAIRSKALAAIGFIAVAFFSYFTYALSTDPYFQYFPHRVIFPALLILLSWIYFNGRSKWAYRLTFLICSIGMLWNLETGVAVFGAWVLALMYDDLSAHGADIRGMLRHGVNGAFYLLAVVLAYIAYIYVRYGGVPDFIEFFKFQLFYYGFGYFMLPMPPIHPWNLVLLAYMVGMAYSVASLALHQHSPRSTIIFLLSVLGAGVFVYYQGRSHDAVLYFVTYPALILLTIFVDDLVEATARGLGARKVRVHQLLLLLLSLSFLAFAVIGMSNISGALNGIATQRDNSVFDEHSTELTEGIAFIKDHTSPGEKVFIISYNAGVYYAETGTESPLDTPGFSELILNSDMSKIYDFMVNGTKPGDKVFLDTYYFEHHGFDDANSFVVKELFQYYTAAGRSNNGNMILFEKNRDKITYSIDVTGKGPDDALFYCAYDAGASAYRTYDNGFIGFYARPSKCNVTLPDRYSIEVALTPEKNAEDAVLLTNDPGSGPREGFTISYDASRGSYGFTVGNGSEAFDALRFSLDGDAPAYLVITADGRSLKAYVDGRLVDSRDAVTLKNSGANLVIGDDALLERPFNGTIRSITIDDHALTGGQVASNWENMTRSPSLSSAGL